MTKGGGTRTASSPRRVNTARDTLVLPLLVLTCGAASASARGTGPAPPASPAATETILDTFHDHRNGYHFVINPLGTQYDALITDEGHDVNTEWDERWRSETKVTPGGWTAEIEIPFTSLRSARDAEVWGVNFKRFIRRKNETAQWTGWDRDFSFLQVSQGAHLTAIAAIRTALNRRAKPSALGGSKKRPPPA